MRASSFSEAMRIGCEIYASLKAVTKKTYGQDACNVGGKGAVLAPPILNNREGVELLMDAIDKSVIRTKLSWVWT